MCIRDRAKSIGVSNFELEHLDQLETKTDETPVVNQVELHPYLQRWRELDAFRAYAEVYPDDCLLLVDTIDTLESGMPNAIQVFTELRAAGHEPIGVRLDSGDLAYLAVEAARILAAAGFEHTAIVLSNDLDELVIWQIQTQIVDEMTAH